MVKAASRETSKIIRIKGARVHNLKNINLEIPKEKIVVITGVSGSGKSSLAFETIYAEGQRRYIESLSLYARQFLGIPNKPDADLIEGLNPAIAIDQKTVVFNPRSTVGTTTEVYDYLRLLFSRIGRLYCYKCGRPVQKQTVQEIVDKIISLSDEFDAEKLKVMLMSPLIKGRKGTHENVFKELKKRGFARVRINNEIKSLDDEIKLDKKYKHYVDVVVDRLVLMKKKQEMSKVEAVEYRQRITDSVETCLKLSEGEIIVHLFDYQKDILFSEKLACRCSLVSYPEIVPNLFSFNSPQGWCPKCQGLGYTQEIDPLAIYNPELSIDEGAFPLTWPTSKWFLTKLQAFAKKRKFSTKIPMNQLPPDIVKEILYGSDVTIEFEYNTTKFSGQYSEKYQGVINEIYRIYSSTQSEETKRIIESFMKTKTCDECKGSRLRKEARFIRIADKNIVEISQMSIEKALEWVNSLTKPNLDKYVNNENYIIKDNHVYKILKIQDEVYYEPITLSNSERTIAQPILKEIQSRLQFLINVGLEYLSLERSSRTLSGGESQRIRLASQIGSGLSGVIYVLDEPSIGLHQKDNDRLLDSLKKLKDLGNTVIVVEHDEDTILSADWIVEIGPQAGFKGGKLIYSGPLNNFANIKSTTSKYVFKRKIVGTDFLLKKIQNDFKTQPYPERFIKIIGARQNNLKNINVSFPIGKFICVTGVSGSGKSTLINDTLYNYLHNYFYKTNLEVGEYDSIIGLEYIDKVINVDQSPIGKTPRSNPATYVGFFDEIRNLLANTTEAKMRGYDKSRFSFNIKGGRCEKCKGEGLIKVEMQFLPDVYVTCEACQGTRYNRETLEIQYKGKNIYEILEMTVDEALVFFENIPSLYKQLKLLKEVGLGYVKLGQPSTTLSGGESQRIKLAAELKKRSTGRTLYILDEPTTGLHFADIDKLLNVLHRLVELGNTVIVIEHNLDVIKTADWIVDLGPGGGDKGGTLIACGSVEEIMSNPNSYTGQYLKAKIEKELQYIKTKTNKSSST